MSILNKYGADLVRATNRQVLKEGRAYVTMYDPQQPSGVPFVIEPVSKEEVVLDEIFQKPAQAKTEPSPFLKLLLLAGWNKQKPIALEINPRDVGGEFMGTLQDPFDNAPGSLLEVWRVDGTLLRDMGSYSPNKELGLGSMDWVCGGTFGRYPEFVPYNHVWIEKSLPADDAPVLVHEITERADMVGPRKSSYDVAHRLANVWESVVRRNRTLWDRPGQDPIQAAEDAIEHIKNGTWR